MNFDLAMSEAVQGARVRAANMAEGSFVFYAFNGWKRQFADGSQTGWHSTEHDEQAEWSIVEEPAIMAFDADKGRPLWATGGYPAKPAPIILTNERQIPKLALDPKKGGW